MPLALTLWMILNPEFTIGIFIHYKPQILDCGESRWIEGSLSLAARVSILDPRSEKYL